MTSSDPPPRERSAGEPAADPSHKGTDTFVQQVYDELRAIARSRLRGEHGHVTLQSTELVHEAYLRLGPADGSRWESRGQFFAAAAEAMRRILIDRARSRGRQKRGGDADGRPAPKLSLDLAEVAALAADDDPGTVLALDEAIERLRDQDARVAEIVRLRFYAGLSVEEVAEVLGTSTRTVLRDWAFARAWLYGELTKG
ncbi:MAG: sigma-70 family RNA polymerase sigma factor [Candidatus Eisenbacteria bacterium]|nr:sigma-70 family RNA polymerase sigma factor [Candidatus Eisenbacteria bacterium]